MISLKCSRCGREIEVSDVLRAEEIRCARCGQQLSPKPAPDPAKTEMGTPLVNMLDDPDSSMMTNQSSLDDTLSPKSPGHVETTSFSYLTPPKGPGELGWLAHYQVLQLLGQGGMGSVFEAVDTHLQRHVALKVMKPELAQDESARQRFLREARATASVKSDYIVNIHQVALHNNIPYLAMEFLQGESLDKKLERQGRLGLEELFHFSIQIARGLSAAHACGLIHRDIKPGNIWLEAVGARAPGAGSEDRLTTAAPPAGSAPLVRVKILDFGLARLTREKSNLTHPGMVMGTPAYMAPEQIEGENVDSRCDLFSLGCILYEMATGEPPFSGHNALAILMAVANKKPRSPRELNPTLPPPLTKLILQLLTKDPKKRPASAQEVGDTLERIADTLAIDPLTPPHGSRRPRSQAAAPPRRNWLLIGLGVSCLVIGGLLGWLGFLWLRG